MIGFSFCSFRYWDRRNTLKYKVNKSVFDFTLTAFPFLVGSDPNLKSTKHAFDSVLYCGYS